MSKSSTPTKREKTYIGRRPGDPEPVGPGEMLLHEFLLPLHITQAKFAQTIGITRSYLSDIVSERRVVSADMALRFEAALGMPAYFWLDLQREVDLYRAQQADPVKFQQIERLHAA